MMVCALSASRREVTAPDSTTATRIVVDPSQQFQTMVGFGAAITDAAAELMQTALSPLQRETLLQELFGRTDSGVWFSGRVRTEILDWDHNWDEPQSPLTVLDDSVARRFVAGVAWHCYAGDVAAQSQVHSVYPGKDVYFTECAGGAWAPNFGDNLRWNVRTLIIGATRHWARGVILWNLALDPQHGPHLGGCADCRGVLTIDPLTGARDCRFDTYRITGMLIGDQSSDYIEVLEIDDFAGFTTEDMAGSTVQSVMGQFMGFMDAPEFMIAEVIDPA